MRKKEMEKSGTVEKEEANRLRARKALDTASALLVIAILIFLFGSLSSAFGVLVPYYPIGLLAASGYIILLSAVAIVEDRVARSRVATKRITAGLALIGIVLVFLVISPGVLPLEWGAPAFLAFSVEVVAGFILFFAGWHRAHQTLRHMAGEYAAHRRRWVWVGTLPTFEVRNYHFILAAGMLGALLLFLSSIITVNVICAVGGFLYLIIMVIVAAIVKTR